MRYMKSGENYGGRFETTYGRSYNRPYKTEARATLKSLEDDPGRSESLPAIKSEAATLIKQESVAKEPNRVISTLRNGSISSNAQSMNVFKSGQTENGSILDYNHMVTQIAMITDSLFLSSMHAITAEKLKGLGVTLVVSLLADSSSLRLPSSIQTVQINIEDTENANIRRHFERVLERINVEERRKGKTLVHCMAGISRSSTIVIAYLMRYGNMHLREAYNIVRDRRPYIQPNLGFWRQLIDYERSIFGSTSVSMVPLEGSRLLVPDVTPSILPEILAASPIMRIQQRTPQSIFPFRSSYSSY